MVQKHKKTTSGHQTSQPREASEETPAGRGKIPPMFRRIDWIAFGVTTLVMMIAYLWTLAPDLTLQDSGELAVASYYAGVPHPPGYPVWTIYTWLFTELFPFSNVAWRVALSSAVAAALSCGFIALMVSRGSSMIIEGIEELRSLEDKWENMICLAAGFAAGALMGFNGFMWSQAVIVEVYTLSVLSLVGVLVCLLRWIYAPGQRRYLYLAMFLFGICFTNHQTLIVAAMGIEVLIAMIKPRLGRDLFLGNSVLFIAGILGKKAGMLGMLSENEGLFTIFVIIGVASVAAWVWLAFKTMKKAEDWISMFRDLLMCVFIVFILGMIIITAKAVPNFQADTFKFGFFVFLGLVSLAGFVMLTLYPQKKRDAIIPDRLTLYCYIGVGLSVLYVLSLITTASHKTVFMNRSLTAFLFSNILGILIIVATGWLIYKKKRFGRIVFPLSGMGGLWLVGAAFYFYMPIASMTNPPMNWGYPRTVQGFYHAMSRGQYERANPTQSAYKFVSEQLRMYTEGVVEEFNFIYIIIGLVPFVFLFKMRRREQGWIIGLTAMFLFLSVLLLILLNPGTDRQSRELHKVFFTASHVIIAMGIGYGLTLLLAYAKTHYEQFRQYLLYSGAVATALAFYGIAVEFSRVSARWGIVFNPLGFETAVYGFILAAGATVALLVSRTRTPIAILLALAMLTPGYSALSHWADNEQRGHLFGFWFGHDMFTPPYDVYPEMAEDAILFGGTDPGRFCPTYMIFCESFIDPEDRRDPDFDRRDIYIITQNALADGTYLDYIRAHYNRSAQDDPPFFQDLVRSKTEKNIDYYTNHIAKLMVPIDDLFLSIGRKIEDARRERGVYPPEEIHTPSKRESEIAFKQYIDDAAERKRKNQLKPGEIVNTVTDESGEQRVQVAGQVSVMQINGILAKIIFDKNPEHEFYVEESFPLDWMYPHMTPYGIIMKINREPVEEITEEMLRKDHEFWKRYSERLIGDFITYNTPVGEIAEFVNRVYRKGDYSGLNSNQRIFARDDDAQKSFSKLRNAIAGLYTWRINRAQTPEEQQRMMKEADFAFKQAFAFCPYSPEVVFRYVNLLANIGRVEDALIVTETAMRFDPENEGITNLYQQLSSLKQGDTSAAAVTNQIRNWEESYRKSKTNAQLGISLANAYFNNNETNKALQILEDIIAKYPSNRTAILTLAQFQAQARQNQNLEKTLSKLVDVVPGNPEAWYDLAGVRATLGMNEEALSALEESIKLSNTRLQTNSEANNLLEAATNDPRFNGIRSTPEFQELMK